MIEKIIIPIIMMVKGKTIKQLRKKGAEIGENVVIMPSAIIDPQATCLLKIGNNVSIANAVIIYAHDASTKMYLGYTKIAKTTIGDYVFIGAGSIVLPGVTIGSNVIVGAGSVVKDNIPDNSVVMGNPARIVCTTDKYIEKNRERMKTSFVYNKPINEMSMEERLKIRETLCEKVGYEV